MPPKKRPGRSVKRGRPRQPQNMGADQPPKRGRGRPRSNKSNMDETGKTLQPSPLKSALKKWVQEKLAKDIEDTLAKHEGKITYDSIQDMKYLDMVISETLRRYPPVQNLFRKVTKPYKVSDSDLILPQGMRVFIPVYAIQNDSKYFPEPNKFLPERFSQENKKTHHPMVYMPFGEGPRNCIGARFGLMQTKLGLATIMRKFKVEIAPPTTVPPKLDPKSFITSLNGGVHLRVTPRE